MVSDDQLIVSGYAYVPKDAFNYNDYIKSMGKPSEDAVLLSSKEVYKELRCRGYDYGPSFQGVVEAMSDGSFSRIKYDQWESFSDSLLHPFILSFTRRSLFLPTFFEYIRCDPKYLNENIEIARKACGVPIVDAYYDSYSGIGITKGLVIKGLKGKITARRGNSSSLVLEKCSFQPYLEKIPIKMSNKKINYIQLCDTIVDYLIQSKRNNCHQIKDEVENWLKHESKYGHLLKLLAKLLPESDEFKSEQTMIEIIEETFKEKPFAIMDDFSFATDLTKLQRCLWDVVLENIPTKTCVLTEINEISESIVYEVAKVFSTGGVRSQTTVLRTDNNSVNSIQDLLKSMLDGKSSDLILYNDSRLQVLPSIVPRNTFKLDDVLKDLGDSSSLLKKSGFILLSYRKELSPIEKRIYQLLKLPEPDFSDINNIHNYIQTNGFVQIAKKELDDGQGCLLLLRKKDPVNPDKIKIVQIKSNTYDWLETLKDDMIKLAKDGRIWLVATGEAHNGLLGMFNCLRKEPRGNILRAIYSKIKMDPVKVLTPEIVEKDLAVNVINDCEQILGSYRHQKLTTNEYYLTKSCNVYLEVVTTGDLTSLNWHQSSLDIQTQSMSEEEKKNKIWHLYYSAINFKDVMVATGRVSLEAYPQSFYDTGLLGMEYSGILNGERVFGMLSGSAIATTLIGPYFKWKVPDSWTLEEAATVPVVYLTAYYSLFCRGNLINGESVLIHAGTGGVGQAAINICLLRGCQVFTTVGTPQKREHIKKLFPSLKDEHIGNSRDTSFEEMIKKQTNGRGVDIVLNSLAEDKFEASLRCLAEYGRFIEIGKYDILQDSPVGKNLRKRERFSFISFYFTSF